MRLAAEYLARCALSALALGWLMGAAGCPLPKPQSPDAGDACAHADSVCPGSLQGCASAVARIEDPSFRVCVAAAMNCASLNACDPGVR